MSLDPTGLAEAAEAVDYTGTGPDTPEGRKIEGRGPWLLAWQRLRRDRVAMISLVIIVLIVLMAILAPLASMITGHPPNEQYRQIGLTPDGLPKGPSSQFWMGTDDLGRDIFVRIAYGARVSLLVGVVATGIAVMTGVVVGLAAGFFGGLVDSVLAPPGRRGPVHSVPACGDRPGVDHRSEPVDHHLRDRVLQLGVRRSHRARPGALATRTGVRGGSKVAGRERLPDHVRGHPAHRAGSGHRLLVVADPRGDHRRGDIVLPRVGTATADR